MNKLELLMKASSVRAKQLLEAAREKRGAELSNKPGVVGTMSNGSQSASNPSPNNPSSVSEIKKAFHELKGSIDEETELLKKALSELEQIKKLLSNKSENE